MNPVTFQFYDYSQMFDSMNLQSAISDIYDNGVDDDQLALLYGSNKEISMAVKTPNGLSERQTVTDIVLQGDTFGSILASVQVDKIGTAWNGCWPLLFVQKYLASGIPGTSR